MSKIDNLLASARTANSWLGGVLNTGRPLEVHDSVLYGASRSYLEALQTLEQMHLLTPLRHGR
ncbi:MAG: hypothetical protein ACYCW6_14405 [Candidatus Xenobia bacterium]